MHIVCFSFVCLFVCLFVFICCSTAVFNCYLAVGCKDVNKLIDWFWCWCWCWCWPTDWLTDWLIDWLIGWLIDSLIDWFIRSFIYSLTHSLTHSFISSDCHGLHGAICFFFKFLLYSLPFSKPSLMEFALLSGWLTIVCKCCDTGGWVIRQ